MSVHSDLDTVSEDTVKELCRGGNVFFNCLGTTRKKAGSAVSSNSLHLEVIPPSYVGQSNENAYLN